jgi:hypothetical protein
MEKLQLRLKSWRKVSTPSPTSKPESEEQESGKLPAFEYSPLLPGNIRVLSPDSKGISPGSAWRLDTVRLDDHVKFDALSYTWGSQDNTFPISINSRCFRVHHNLFSALPYLAKRKRRKARRLPIWVDAVCINQNDKEEIAEQVALMHKIYRRAKMVWVWLGLGNSEMQARIPEAITLLDNIAIAGKERHKSYPKPCEGVEAASGLCGLEPALLGALGHLLGNSWFSRVWV